MVEYQDKELDLVFSALADPTRRAILCGLAKGPATVSEIAKPFRVSLNAVSKHVMVLERAGLLSREIQGRKHICRVEQHGLQEAANWLHYYQRFWEARMDALERYVARRAGSTEAGASKKGSVHGKAH